MTCRGTRIILPPAFGQEVDAWSHARDKLSSTKTHLNKDREDLICRLYRLGVRSSEDVEHCGSNGKIYAKELVALEEQLRTIDRHLAVYDETVAQSGVRPPPNREGRIRAEPPDAARGIG